MHLLNIHFYSPNFLSHLILVLGSSSFEFIFYIWLSFIWLYSNWKKSIYNQLAYHFFNSFFSKPIYHKNISKLNQLPYYKNDPKFSIKTIKWFFSINTNTEWQEIWSVYSVFADFLLIFSLWTWQDFDWCSNNEHQIIILCHCVLLWLD